MSEELNPSLEFQTINGKEISLFTQNFKNILYNSVNPKLFIVVGRTREGKSTLLNHLLLDKTLNLPENLRLSRPFKARGGEEATTKEFLFYGPMKMSEFSRRNKLEFNGEDSDCFFIDTEGTGNLYQMSKNLFHGIFALESVSTCILFLSKGIIDQETILYISRHIQTSKLFNSTSKDNFPGFAIIGRDIGIQNYDITFEEQEKERIHQDNTKLNDLKTRLQQNTGINFSEQNLKYIAEPPIDMPKLFFNSIKDLCKFMIQNSAIQSKRSPNDIINKFDSHEKFINKYPVLLDTNVPMEETFNKVFKSEVEEVSNKIKQENTNLILDKIKNLSLVNLSNIQPETYKNKILSELDSKFKKEANSRYYGIEKIIEAIYKLSLLNLRKYFSSLIQTNLDEKIQYFIDTMKSFIEKAKNESEIQIKQSIFGKIEDLSSQQLRGLNIAKYIEDNISNEIKKFHEKANSFFPDIKNIIQTKDLYISKTELVKNFIKVNTQEKLRIKMEICPPWPKNIQELMKEQKINKLIPNSKYILYLNKKPYEIIARNDGKITLPNIKAIENYKDEELPCWRSSGGKIKEEYNTAIDTWFEPDSQILILSKNNVYQNNTWEGGHKVLINIFGGSKPPRPQQKRTTISLHVDKQWKIKSFVKSGNVSVSLSNNNSDMFVSGIGGSVQNIKLELNN